MKVYGFTPRIMQVEYMVVSISEVLMPRLERLPYELDPIF